MQKHDIHDFVRSSQRIIEEEYARITIRASEDPGTAGDQGEENWATLLRSWLPSYFHIVTKGRILTGSGYASPQIDILVLMPSYPEILLDKKLYLSAGVAAAFECKTTLKAVHIRNAANTAAELRRHMPKRTGTPYKELKSTIIYGVLAHSHSWKGPSSRPVDNISKALADADRRFAEHPVECLDFVTVADLGSWNSFKVTYMSPRLPYYNDDFVKIYGPQGSAVTSHMCAHKDQEYQEEFFSPIGTLLSH